MTTTRKPRKQKVELGPEQIYLKRSGAPNPQELVDGYPDWSMYSCTTSVHLYYKGSYRAWLTRQPDGSFQESYPDHVLTYASLTDFLEQHSQHYGYALEHIDHMNERDGITDWYIRQSFTLIPLTLDIPDADLERLNRLASVTYSTVEELILKGLYFSLKEMERIYQDKLRNEEKPVDQMVGE